MCFVTKVWLCRAAVAPLASCLVGVVTYCSVMFRGMSSTEMSEGVGLQDLGRCIHLASAFIAGRKLPPHTTGKNRPLRRPSSVSTRATREARV